MKISMRAAMTGFLFLVSVSAFAQSQIGKPIEVREIERGACWMAETSPGHWKIASFNDRSSGVTDAELIRLNLFSRIDARLKELGLTTFAARDLKIHFRCSPGAHELTLSLPGSEHAFCVTTDLKNTKFELDANHDAKPGEPCVRSLIRELLVFPKSNDQTAALAAVLSSADRAFDIQEVTDNKTWIKLRLTEKWALRENEAIAALSADPAVTPLLKQVIYNYRLNMGGTVVELGQSQYPGF